MAKVTKGKPPFREGQKVTVGAVASPGWTRLSINTEPKDGGESLLWVDLRPPEVKDLISMLRVGAEEAPVVGSLRREDRAHIAASLREAAATLSAGESLQAPQVNNNGTSKKDLMEQLIAVAHAGREMQKALSNAAPHGRDYQTLKPGMY